MKHVIASRSFTDHILSVQTGTTIPHISAKQILDFKFRLPPIEEQQRIANILGALDDEIELNRRMNEALEAMARALFKSWFADFDPVRAKGEGGDVGLPASLADLFPDSFVDSELGGIPTGWEVRAAWQCLALLKDGGHNPPKRVPRASGSLPVDCIRHFSVDFAKCTYVSQEDYQAMHRKWSVQAGDVLLTIVGTVGNVALVAENDLPFSLQRRSRFCGQREALLARQRERVNSLLLGHPRSIRCLHSGPAPIFDRPSRDLLPVTPVADGTDTCYPS